MASHVEKLVKRRRWLARYMMETPFHGFGIAAHAHSYVEFTVWWLIVIGCGVLTIYQTAELIRVYQSEPTVTLITVTHSGNLSSDKVHLCFDWEFIPGDVEHLLSSVDTLLNVSDSQIELLKAGSFDTTAFDPDLIRLILAMVVDIELQEDILVDKLPFWERMWGGVTSPTNATELDRKLNYALYQVYKYFASKHVPMRRLAQLIGLAACQAMEIKMFMWKGGDSKAKVDYQVCRAENIASVFCGGYCMYANATNNRFAFISTFDHLFVTANPAKLNLFFNQTIPENRATNKLTLDLMGGQFDNKINLYLTVNRYDTYSVQTIDIHGHYFAHNSHKRPCNPVRNGAQFCRDMCEVDKAVQLCSCWPYWASYLPNVDEIPSCADEMGSEQTSAPYYIPDYHQCLANNSLSGDLVYECYQECHDDCEHIKMTFATEARVRVENPSWCDLCSTAVVFKVRSFTYPEIVEEPAKTLGNFVAEFGGLLGLWLGGSFIAFSHVLVFCIRALHAVLYTDEAHKGILKRKRKKNKKNKMFETC